MRAEQQPRAGRGQGGAQRVHARVAALHDLRRLERDHGRGQRARRSGRGRGRRGATPRRRAGRREGRRAHRRGRTVRAAPPVHRRRRQAIRRAPGSTPEGGRRGRRARASRRSDGASGARRTPRRWSARIPSRARREPGDRRGRPPRARRPSTGCRAARRRSSIAGEATCRSCARRSVSPPPLTPLERAGEAWRLDPAALHPRRPRRCVAPGRRPRASAAGDAGRAQGAGPHRVSRLADAPRDLPGSRARSGPCRLADVLHRRGDRADQRQRVGPVGDGCGHVARPRALVLSGRLRAGPDREPVSGGRRRRPGGGSRRSTRSWPP